MDSSAQRRTEAALQLRPIPLACIRPDTVTGFDIYIYWQRSAAPVLYRARHVPITEETLIQLFQRGRSEIWVPCAQEIEYRRYLENNLDTILSESSISTAEKSQILYDSASGLMRDVLEDPRAAGMARRSKALVARTSAYLVREKSAFGHLMSLVAYDYETYTHSVNVFVFGLMLAQYAGFTDRATLEEFGEGILLHDIGKSMVNPEIIRCRGALSNEQWREMRRHPEFGYAILKEHGKFSPLTLSIVRSHHEKMTGRGYPDALAPDEITPLVRIATIADIFDALTTNRPYKDAMGSFPALQTMQDVMSHELDPSYFKLFIELMGNPFKDS